jgi:uncharacterized protein (TIGR02996 family)
MSEEEAFLAAFLAEPIAPTPRRTYLAWLDEQGHRGEYLRLLTSALDEPTAPCPGGPVRERLRQLRGQIASDWAVRVDKTRLVTDGVYQSIPCPEGWNYLRFCSDGTVLSICSTETPAKVWQRLNSADDLSGFCRGSYALGADELWFNLPYQPPDSLVQEWQVLKQERLDQQAKELSSSLQTSGALLAQLEELKQAPSDRWIAAEISRLEASMDPRRRQAELTERMRQHETELDQKMRRLRYSGAIGQRTLCLKWYSDFNDAYFGIATYWLAVATGTARVLVMQPSERAGESLPGEQKRTVKVIRA